ncbi:MAG: V-type ATP synthase subunit I [Lachnospiraceae bacterium]|nr:V-type ATP synthase subunit I [Lachnospiraceae bacterium]
MAIVKMQKLGICGTREKRQEILLTLQDLGVMEMRLEDLTEDPELELQDTTAARSRYEKRADSFYKAVKLLNTNAPEKKKGLDLFPEKRKITREELDRQIEDRHRFNLEIEKIQHAEKDINDARGVIQKLDNQKTALKPWMDLDIPMDMKGTKKTDLIIGTIPGSIDASALYALAAKDMEEPAAVDANVISTEAGQTCVTVLCLKDEREKVEENLRSGGFARLSSVVQGVPRDAAEGWDREIEEQKKIIEQAEKKIASFADSREDFKLMADYYRDRAERYRLLGTIPQSEKAFFLEGFVKADQADAIIRLLSEKYGAYAEKEETKEGETEPTILDNNSFSEAAEGVLESYGLPEHGKADPTFIMSIFYVIFFGMMFSDGGYGILMAVVAFIALKKFKGLSEGMRKMVKLFFWCGISTAFWGFMYGGFFGDAIDVIAKTFFGYTGETPILKPLWFEPLKDPMRLLVWCMFFGLIHLFFGLGIKGYEYLKNKDFVGFVSDILSWYMFIIGLVLLLLPSDLFSSIAGSSFDFSGLASLHTLAIALTLIGLVIIVFMQERAAKSFVLRVLLGLYDVYGVTGWLSDVLSYSRLLALGLATGVIANVINMMASMMGNSILGIIVFIVVFVLGHLLNFGINALGAYVHTNRLQFVEFFGKFYEGGGRSFKAFKTNHKYIEIKEETLS